MRLPLLLASLPLLALGGCGVLTPEPVSATVTGEVVSVATAQPSRPLPGIPVVLYSAYGDRLAETVTDAGGRFTLTPEATGAVVVETNADTSHAAYDPAWRGDRQTRTVQSGRTYTLLVRLWPNS